MIKHTLKDALTAIVSPRPIPGVKGGIHHVTGVEHNEEGRRSL